MREVVAHVEGEGQRLRFVIRWSGGVHTGLEMDKPGYGWSGKKTSMEALEVVRRMAERGRDGSVLRGQHHGHPARRSGRLDRAGPAP